jgi:hypothetical protein
MLGRIGDRDEMAEPRRARPRAERTHGYALMPLSRWLEPRGVRILPPALPLPTNLIAR